METPKKTDKGQGKTKSPVKAKLGRPKSFKSAEFMWETFLNYKKTIDESHLFRADWVGKNAKKIKREYTKVLTMEGFECYVMDQTLISYPDLTHYFENTEKRYEAFVPVCARIKREIRRDQVEKGLAGLINPSITQRLNGLVEKTQTEHKGGINIPNLPDIGNR